jgi:hypothetical protein
MKRRAFLKAALAAAALGPTVFAPAERTFGGFLFAAAHGGTYPDGAALAPAGAFDPSPDGGFLIPEEFAAEIYAVARGERPPVEPASASWTFSLPKRST